MMASYGGGGGGGGGEMERNQGAAITTSNLSFIMPPSTTNDDVPLHSHTQDMATLGSGLDNNNIMKRKRGRPRKYSPPPLDLPHMHQPLAYHSSPTAKKPRGRPPGSSSKTHHFPNRSGGTGFTPHLITVKAGEDVLLKIMSFSQNGPRGVCILSAYGAISNVALRQVAMSGGIVTYEGPFQILSLSGSFLLTENGGQRSRTGGLSVILSGPDGRVLGGGVAGLLTAASSVQVIVGSFIWEDSKGSKMWNNQPENMSAPGALVAGSPPSRGTFSESSGGAGSPPIQSAGAGGINNNPQGMPNLPWK